MQSERIPNRFHFIWFGKHLPEFAHVAIRSALIENPGSTATLWHDDDFEPSAETRMLASHGLDRRRIDFAELVSDIEELRLGLDTGRLSRICETLHQPAGRANLVRLFVLTLYGGVYLDTDTLTVQNLSELRTNAAFCGEERILWPSGTSRLDPRPLALGELRRLCSHLPGGFRVHRALLPYYSLAANNAVLGATPRHALLLKMLRMACEVPVKNWKRRYRFGTHLLQNALREYVPPTDALEHRVRVLEPDFFYPVGPEISRHYFMDYSDPSAVAQELIGEKTHVIHWYASVADLSSRGFRHIAESAERDVYSYLCSRHVTESRVAAAESALAVAPPLGASVPSWGSAAYPSAA